MQPLSIHLSVTFQTCKSYRLVEWWQRPAAANGAAPFSGCTVRNTLSSCPEMHATRTTHKNFTLRRLLLHSNVCCVHAYTSTCLGAIRTDHTVQE